MAAHLHRANDTAFVDGIDADSVGPKITDVEQAVIGGDDSANRLVTDEVAATNLVVGCLDDGKIVAAKIAHEQLTAIGLQRELHGHLAHVEQGQHPVRYQIDRGELIRTRTRDERLTGIGQDDDVLWLLADRHRAAHRKLLRIDDGNRIVGAIADDRQLSIGRDLGETRRTAHLYCCDDRPFIKIDDRNIGRAGVGHVSTLAIRGNRDEVGRAMNPNGRFDCVALRANDADVIGVGIGNVDFVAGGTGGDARRTCAYRDRLDIAKLKQIENADRVALAVGNVGVFVVAGFDGRALMAGGRAQREDHHAYRSSPPPRGKLSQPPPCCAHQRAAADPAVALPRRTNGSATGSATERPSTLAIWRTSAMRSSNCCGKSDWLPSLRAWSGSVWTSMIKPSAPTATAARDSGVTLLRLPVPWLGSTIIGRWLKRCTAGTMLRSSVLRVWSAKVRTPRSHRITL